MASADAFTLSTRVPNKTAEEFKKVADSLGMTPNALIKDMVERAVNGKPAVQTPQAPEQTDKAREQIETEQITVPRTYKVALDLVDELTEAGYPENEIVDALNGVRRDRL